MTMPQPQSTSRPSQLQYADMPLKTSEDFREVMNAMRRSINKQADATNFTARQVMTMLKRYEKRLKLKKLAEAKKHGEKTLLIRANYARARTIGYSILAIASLQRAAAKRCDATYRKFLAKYADDVMGRGEKIFDHRTGPTPRAPRQSA